MRKKKPITQGKARKTRKPTKHQLVFYYKYIELVYEKTVLESKAESVGTRISTDW